ncbi:conserved protein of unknown function [Sterolibacterium denitrificans]|uniref:Uncharacterized protein n=2 Tax=Sterolibacterium denitrificans TaxID=157592 RepID=A0A656Z983_9PROT|nr:DUF2889 domain-containing protein [Sterolibacterium denitrificans]KYC29368.1 hypothetical protein ACY05_02260 [Sterolibacterium denitrificans]SMB31119.1 conserved protein of unknown function [Sterolibacterium denitrificans]
MPLSPPTAARRKIHNRRIQLEGWKREDGLWDIEGRLTDTKDHDYSLGSGIRKAGDAVHDMWVRITIDQRFNVVAAEAHSAAVPYPGCERIAPSYQKLVGLNLMRDFRRNVHELFGSVKGCSHLTELLMVLPAVAFQTFASDMTETTGYDAGQKPFPLDKCHALETTTEIVRRYYPLWYRGEGEDARKKD